MKIYKIAQNEAKTIKWECPNTGIYILGHWMGKNLIEYAVHSSDGSFYDAFDNFFHASNWIRKHVDKNFKAPYTGLKISTNLKNIKTAYLRGEWWIIGGSAHFADGDVGDFNHEAYSIQYAQDLLMDGQDDWESWKSQKAFEIFQELTSENDLENEYEMKQEAENDPELFLLNHLDDSGIDSDIFFVANGNHSDPRDWSMKALGWKRMAGNDITTWTLSRGDLESIRSGIDDAFPEENLDNEKFNIEVKSNNSTYWGVPYSVIENMDLSELRGYGNRSQYGRMSSVNIFKLKTAQDTTIVYKTVIVRKNPENNKLEFRSLYNPNSGSAPKWTPISIGSTMYGKWYVGTKAKFCIAYYSGNEDLNPEESEVLLKLQVAKNAIPEDESYMGSEAVVTNPLVIDIQKITDSNNPYGED